ncbi:hypothetical protein T484DRAFT_2389820 [Baffinella frigidus]|nr:hypothetical protein T484DRAFT_2389820 [Cryptophyta sp. CCMP2293]
MAPEVTAGLGCSPSSDCYSFGGLVFASIFPDVEPSLSPITQTVHIPPHRDPDVPRLLAALLSPAKELRPSAAQALAHPAFSAPGQRMREDALRQAVAVDLQLAILEGERDALRGESAAQQQALKEEGGRIERERERLVRRARVCQEESAGRRKVVAEESAAVQEQLRSVVADKARLGAREKALVEEQGARQRELDRKGKALREEEAKVKKKAAAAARRACFSLPPHWSAASEGKSASALSLVHVKDRGVRSALQACLEGTHIGDGGRDQRLTGQYSKLVLQEAWRIENTGLMQSYQGANRRVMALEGKVKASLKEKIRPELYRGSRELPWELRQSCNEVRLLHGTQPQLVLSILTSGMNERFAGAGAGTRFGQGVYFADDSGKIDQYVSVDDKYSTSSPLHQMLYDGNCRHPGDVFYALVCRVTLGCSRLCTSTPGDFHPKTRERELCDVPGTVPPVPHHSLIARKALSGFRFDEYVVFHSDLTYPEYLVAYQRK